MGDSFFDILKKKEKDSTISSVTDMLSGMKISATNVEAELEKLLEVFSKTSDINDTSVRDQLSLTEDLIFKPKNVLNKILSGLEKIDKMPIPFRTIFYEVNDNGSFSKVFRNIFKCIRKKNDNYTVNRK